MSKFTIRTGNVYHSCFRRAPGPALESESVTRENPSQDLPLPGDCSKNPLRDRPPGRGPWTGLGPAPRFVPGLVVSGPLGLVLAWPPGPFPDRPHGAWDCTQYKRESVTKANPLQERILYKTCPFLGAVKKIRSGTGPPVRTPGPFPDRPHGAWECTQYKRDSVTKANPLQEKILYKTCPFLGAV